MALPVASLGNSLNRGDDHPKLFLRRTLRFVRIQDRRLEYLKFLEKPSVGRFPLHVREYERNVVRIDGAVVKPIATKSRRNE